jgi:hypothetical protein
VSTAHGVKRLLYLWTLPNTLLGLPLAVAAMGTGGRARVQDGVVEAYGGAVTFILRRLVLLRGGASAMTLGHVVVGRDAASLERTRTHERVHVRQYEAWGPFFLSAYAVASLVAAARGRHYYRDNRFEIAARAAERPAGTAGGRIDAPPARPLP